MRFTRALPFTQAPRVYLPVGALHVESEARTARPPPAMLKHLLLTCCAPALVIVLGVSLGADDLPVAEALETIDLTHRVG